jgi:ABC-type multidrug transport system fused ATPase/permease subunit
VIGRGRRQKGDPASSMSWERLRPLVGGRKRPIAGLAAISALSGLTEAVILAAVAQVAASLVSGETTVSASVGAVGVEMSVGVLLGVAAGLAVVRLLLQVPIALLPARIAADVQATLRRDLFEAFTRASWAVQSEDREGHLQEMMTSQVVQATQGAQQVTIMITSLFSFLVLIVSALALNVGAAIVVLTAAVALFALLRPMNTLGHRRSRALSQAQMEYAGGIGEAVRVAEETHVFGVAAAQRQRIGTLVSAARGLFLRTQFVGRLVPALYQSLIFLVIVLGLAALYASDAGNVASLGAVVLLLVRAGTYGQQLQSSYQLVRQALPFVERLQEAERRYLESAQPAGSRPLPAVRTIGFERVSFAYRAERPVLSEISFEVRGGEAIGVVGPSGAGKSTLVQLLLQLREPQGGRYLLNGEPASEFTAEDWHRRVAYVPQEPRLLHASAADNIRYFRPLPLEAVERAARLARIDDDIRGWAQGYETIVGPRANAVSGGQQQRICLARALAASPEVLILDEPTSALDPRSEALIQDSLLGLKEEMTIFAIAHRISTLDMCDRVMVIVDGRLDAFDTTAALLERNPYYRSASGLGESPAGQAAS